MKTFYGRGARMAMGAGALLLLAVSVAGQESQKKSSFRGAGYFILGTSFLGFSDLNAVLENEGYSKFSGKTFTSGGGGHLIIGRLVLGAEGQAIRAGRFSADKYRTSLSAVCGFFNAGYVLYRSRTLDVYPLCGLGAGKISLTMAEKEPPSFDDVIANPAREAGLSTSGFLLNLALGADWFFGLGGDAKNEGGLLIGIRAGYTFAPVKSGWELGAVEIDGGPRAGINGPYIRIIIGGGGRSR